MNAEVDVAIVGYGPVGQALAAMLRRAGHNVAAFERFNEIYRLPRAVHIDHEIMRLLQAVGLGERLAEEMVPLREDRWFGALFRKAKIRRTSGMIRSVNKPLRAAYRLHDPGGSPTAHENVPPWYAAVVQGTVSRSAAEWCH